MAMPTFTLVIEEEFQTIDPHTRELRSHMSKIVEDGRITLHEQVKAEMHEAVVEVGWVLRMWVLKGVLTAVAEEVEARDLLEEWLEVVEVEVAVTQEMMHH